MVEYVRLALRRYADFQGRSRRAEYWWFALAMALFDVAARVLVEMFKNVPLLNILVGLAIVVAALALIVPSLAVSFRRLHDTDRSAWWLLLVCIPIIGVIVVLVFMVLPGTVGPNRFGPDPITDAPAGVAPDAQPPLVS
jgi:uncharacterized membrane protein YhaH (DUF805 family)